MIDARDQLDIRVQILAPPIGGLQLIDALEDADLAVQPLKALAVPIAPTFHVAVLGAHDLKGAAENALAVAQKVGRTTKHRMLSRNHACFLSHIGCETP